MRVQKALRTAQHQLGPERLCQARCRLAHKLTEQDMENFVRDGATTYFHQAGTCRMGKDPSRPLCSTNFARFQNIACLLACWLAAADLSGITSQGVGESTGRTSPVGQRCAATQR
jgi:hypothetical protein